MERSVLGLLTREQQNKILDLPHMLGVRLGKFQNQGKDLDSVSTFVEKEIRSGNSKILNGISDLVLLEVLQNPMNDQVQTLTKRKVFVYFLQSYLNLTKKKKYLSGQEFVQETKQLIVNYLLLLLKSPMVLTSEIKEGEQYVKFVEALEVTGGSQTILKILWNECKKDPEGTPFTTLTPLLPSAIRLYDQVLQKSDQKQSARINNLLIIIASFFKFSAIRTKLIESCEDFYPRQLEKESSGYQLEGLFSHLFRFPVLERNPELMGQYFLRSKTQFDNLLKNERRITEKYISNLSSIVLLIAKHRGLRPKLFLWIRTVLSSHANRIWDTKFEEMKSPLDPNSDNFLVILACVLLKLCEPFLDPDGKMWEVFNLDQEKKRARQGKKIVKPFEAKEAYWVHPTNLAKFCGHQLLISRLISQKFNSKKNKLKDQRQGSSNGNKKDKERLKNENERPQVNDFVSDCFFLAQEAISIGVLPLLTRHTLLLIELQKAQEQIKTEKQKNVPNENLIKEYQIQITEHFSKLNGRETLLYVPWFNNLMFKFYNFTIHWICDLSGVNKKQNHQSRSLPQMTSRNIKVLTMLPEFVLTNIYEYCTWTSNLNVVNLASQPKSVLHSVYEFCILFACSPNIILNPLIRHSLFVCYLQCLQLNGNEGNSKKLTITMKNNMDSVFNVQHFHNEKLIWSILIQFLDYEYTGRTSQYYDKLSLRQTLIAVLLRLFKRSKLYVKQIGTECRNEDIGIRFVNYLIRDLSSIMGIMKDSFDNVKDLSILIQKNKEKMFQNELIEIEKSFNDRKNVLKSRSNWTNQIILLLIDLISNSQLINLFLNSQIKGTFIETMSNALKLFSKLAFQCNTQKLDFGYKTIELLTNFSKLMILMYQTNDTLIQDWSVKQMESIISKKKHFDLVSKLVENLDYKIWNLIIEKIFFPTTSINTDPKTIEKIPEYDKEPPDEFCCTLLYNLMCDPVKTPSGVIVDRQNIEKHLMTDSTDPFSRKPLTVEMLEPLHDLQKKINDWKLEHLL
ncbi:ubiquitin conjugation factor e4 a [Anaeramoeba flamelloides]|uniref:Ubiquitin conjugation factor e4 a n=1 Tax=Anaeramoeba flamelloides TaxID=1746091 RepID=A0ABQ8XZ92_9EUKA|nr:ubiquitin conjugation factor e4 a [Anaeramoeba flamelloides]